VVNQDYASGQVSSVRCGLSSVKTSSRATFIALGDQPRIPVSTIETMLEAFENRGVAETVVPYFSGNRGNPVLVSANARKDILAGKRNFGCRNFMDKNPGLVCNVDIDDAGVITDLDTPEEYQDYCTNIATTQPEAELK